MHKGYITDSQKTVFVTSENSRIVLEWLVTDGGICHKAYIVQAEHLLW